MDTQTLTSFFMWCTIINAGFLTLSIVMMISIGDLAYRIHSKWFPMPRQTFAVVIYSFLGLYKVLFIAFNLVPWVALLIVG
jgi:hypothetical protein